MQQNLGRLVDAVCSVREFQRGFENGNNETGEPPVLVLPTLVSAVEKKIGLPIDVLQLPLDASSMRGALLRYESRAQILVSENQSNCWRRYVIAKELSHLIADHEGTYLSGDAIEVQAKSAMRTRSGRYLISRVAKCGEFELPVMHQEQLDSETFCWHMALHLLVPWAFWDEMLHLVDNKSTYQAANRFKIPEVVVEDLKDERFRELCLESHRYFDTYYKAEPVAP